MNYGLGQVQRNPIDAPEPRMVGVHEAAGQIFNRIVTTGDLLGKLLSRVRGAQPEQACGNQKNPEMPSVLGILGDINIELGRVEAYLNELGSVIG